MPSKKISGLFLVLPDGQHIKVRSKKISFANIVGERVVRYGVASEQTVNLVDTATYPIFDARSIYRILEQLGVKVEEFIEPSAEGSPLLAGQRPAAEQEIPAEIQRLFPDAPDPIGRLEGLAKVFAAGLAKQPLQSYSRGYKNLNGEAVDSSSVKRYMVASVDEEGMEHLAEFPYLETTHFMPVKEKGKPDEVNVIPRIYLDKFLPEGHYEIYAADDAGRFMMHSLAQRYLNGDYEFPNGEKGEAMIIIDGFHLTSGTTQEYYVLLWPEFYTDKEGKDKFIWRMMTTKTRIMYSKGMAVPVDGEVPKTVQAQKRMLTPSVAVLLEGVV